MGDAHLFRNGRVFTGRHLAEALLIDDGRVVAAGPEATLRRDAPTGATVHDLAGDLLAPGLIDAHVHLGELARQRERFDAGRAGSLGELVDELRRWAEAHRSGAIVGVGWTAEQFREGRGPDRSLLDRAADDRPLLLVHASGHVVVLNSSALAAAGIGGTTLDPAGGRIGREADGTPNGWLYEEATRLAGPVRSASPPGPEAIRSTLEAAAALGLTTVATMNASLEESAGLRALAEQGPLPVRVRVYVRLSELDRFAAADLAPAGRAADYAVRGVKAFTDGAFGPRTAWLSQPYSDAPQESGLSVGSDEALARGIQEASHRGLAPALHAIGDRAVERALRLLAAPRPPTAGPARIEHAALTPPSLFALLDRVRPVLVVQPGFVWSDWWLASRLGRSRARWAYVFRSLIDRGLLLAASSDAPSEPLDPWRGLAACVTRSDGLGRSANPETREALPAEEAWMLYARNGGIALGEPELGELTAASRADLVRLTATDLRRAVASGNGGVRETWVEGRCVYARAAATDNP